MSLLQLDRAGVGQQLVFGEQQAVADAQLGAVLPGEQAAEVADVDDRELRRALRLAVEEVGDRRHGVELELLVGVELELHATPQSRPVIRDSRITGVRSVVKESFTTAATRSRLPSAVHSVREFLASMSALVQTVASARLPTESGANSPDIPESCPTPPANCPRFFDSCPESPPPRCRRGWSRSPLTPS